MGNCNCLKLPLSQTKFQSDINVDGNIGLGPKPYFKDNIISNESEIKISYRGVSNPTQNNIKKNIKNEIKKDSSKSVTEYKEQAKKIENNKLSKEKLDLYTENNNFKNDSENQIREILSKRSEKKLNRKLTDIVKSKDFIKINKDKKNINIVLLGDKSVGKTSIIFQYSKYKFDQYYITTIDKEELKKNVNIGKKSYMLNLTATSGDPQYKGDYTNEFKNADFFLLVYDICNHETFEKLKIIMNKEINQYISMYKEDYSNVLLIGNKVDLKNRKVSQEEVTFFCKKYFLDHFEVSAKNNLDIGKIFSKVSEIFDEMVSK